MISPFCHIRGDAVQKSPLQVILIDDADDDLCINHELVLRGHAKFTVASSSIAKEEQQLLADAGMFMWTYMHV